MVITIRKREDHMTNAQISHSIEAMENDPEMDLSIFRTGPVEAMETPLVLHQLKGEGLTEQLNRQRRSDQPINAAFRRPDKRPLTCFTPHEQNFPQNNNQATPNMVRFTTIDETITDLLNLLPLNS